MIYKQLKGRLIYTLIFLGYVTLTACSGGGSGSDFNLGDVSTNYPHLTAKPQISYTQNIYNPTQYDVTVTVEADGPTGVYAVGLWLHSSTNSSVFTSLDLQHIGGNTWSATTHSLLPLPSGNYYLDTIMIEDSDPFNGGQIRSSWYETGFVSSNYYEVDQRLTDWDTVDIMEFNYGISNITVVNFTLP